MSTSKEDKFSDKWREALDDAELEPSPHVWTKVNQSLKERKFSFGFWYYLIPVITLLLFFFGIGYLVLRHPISQNQTQAQLNSSAQDQTNILIPKSSIKETPSDSDILNTDEPTSSEEKNVSKPKNITPENSTTLKQNTLDAPNFMSNQDNFLNTPPTTSPGLINEFTNNSNFGLSSKQDTTQQEIDLHEDSKNTLERQVITLQNIDNQDFKREKDLLPSQDNLTSNLPTVEVPRVTNRNSRFWVGAAFNALNYQTGP